MTTHRAAMLLLAILAAALPTGLPAGQTNTGRCAGCVVVTTGPGQYVGSMLIPAGSRPVPVGLPNLASRCPGCVWTLEPACQTPRLTGGVMCPGAQLTCPRRQLRLALLLARPGALTPVRVGTFCYDPTVALQPTGILPGVRARFVQLLPALHPSFQPTAVAIVNVPVLFAAGQPGSLGRPRFTLAGHVVDLAATASWTWQYGDGASGWFAVPGGGYPDTDVAHPYLLAGQFAVTVTTTWQGQYWVDNTGPFVVSGAPVTQVARLVVTVLPARAVLVGGSA